MRRQLSVSVSIYLLPSGDQCSGVLAARPPISLPKSTVSFLDAIVLNFYSFVGVFIYIFMLSPMVNCFFLDGLGTELYFTFYF